VDDQLSAEKSASYSNLHRIENTIFLGAGIVSFVIPKGVLIRTRIRPEWHEDKEDLGRFIAPEGLEDSAQGFNPGNRPPG
jgi:hypothetical protein